MSARNRNKETSTAVHHNRRLIGHDVSITSCHSKSLSLCCLDLTRHGVWSSHPESCCPSECCSSSYQTIPLPLRSIRLMWDAHCLRCSVGNFTARTNITMALVSHKRGEEIKKKRNKSLNEIGIYGVFSMFDRSIMSAVCLPSKSHGYYLTWLPTIL